MATQLAHKAKDPIRHEAMRLAGAKVDNPRRIEVLNPYTEQVIGTVPKATVEDIRRAFQIAAAYRSKLTRYERSAVLRRTAEIIASRREEIADLITAESGLSKKDSLYETGRSFDVFNLAANMAMIDDGQIFSCDVSPQGKQRRIYTQRDPVKAISAITPFNHPLNQVAHKVAPSIATNNKMVLKPSEKTPLTALLLADILYEAGLPPQMLSVVTGDPTEIGLELITNPNVEVVTFTGGVSVGKWIAANAGYRRMVLELGGNDPLIVMEDADLDRASDLAVAGSYKNSGQRCTAVKRILVQESVADRFTELLVEKTKKVTYGDPMDPATDMGTVIDAEAAELMERSIRPRCSIASGRRWSWCGSRPSGRSRP
jgi:putative phosphonoacetaldehyde dehydrogenase